MIALMTIAWRSAWNRRFTLLLTVLSIALATTLTVGVQRLRSSLRSSFSSAVSGTDLIVGARGGNTELLLYAVFHMGGATNNMSWHSVQALKSHDDVAWVIPLSLGDSHRGFTVLGTNGEYFEHFRYGDRRPLELRDGKPFDKLFDAVIGAEVADKLHYRLGQRITLEHGSGELAPKHADKQFEVVGILARTGTPVDRTVHVTLEAIQAIHLDWMAGAPIPGFHVTAEQAGKLNLAPKNVTAALVGLKHRSTVLTAQRWVATFADEPLTAVLPGVALDELWQVVSVVEKALMAVSSLVVFISLAGLVSVVLVGLNERRRELAVLRAVGAGMGQVAALLTLEGVMLAGAGGLLGICLVTLCVVVAGPWLQSAYGIALGHALPSLDEWKLAGLLAIAGLFASLLPGLRAYRLTLADGLSPRI